MTRIWAVVLLGITVLWPNVLLAQSPDETSGPVRVGEMASTAHGTRFEDQVWR